MNEELKNKSLADGKARMIYPTFEQAAMADAKTLADWVSYLPPPGETAIGTEHFEQTQKLETKILDFILARKIGNF